MLCFIHDCTLTLNSFLEAFFFSSLHAFLFFQCVFFGCLLDWNRAPLFMSALSVSAFAQILHRESDLLLFLKRGDENDVQGWQDFFHHFQLLVF